LSPVATTIMPSSNGPLEIEMGPDGALYVMNYGGYRTTSATSGIFRIEYRGTCRPTSLPIAFHRARAGVELARLNGAFLKVVSHGAHRIEVRTVAGALLWSRQGTGTAEYDTRSMRADVAARHEGASGVRLLSVTASGEDAGRFVRRLIW